MKKWLRILGSIAIIYHLTVIVTAPMNWSVWGRALSPYIADYANLLGVNVLWQFFSPLPSPTMYLEYSLMSFNGDDEQRDENEGLWPPRERAGFWRENWNRRSYSMRYMSADARRMEEIFAAWLCAKFSGTDRVEVIHYILLPPNMERLQPGEMWADRSDLQTAKSIDWNCQTNDGDMP